MRIWRLHDGVYERAHLFASEGARTSVCGTVRLSSPPQTVVSDPTEWWPCAACIKRDGRFKVKVEPYSPPVKSEASRESMISYTKLYELQDQSVDQPDSTKMKMVVIIRGDLNLSPGKAISQACHAAVGSVADAKWRWGPIGYEQDQLWESNGRAKIALRADSEKVLLHLSDKAAELDLPHYLVRDAGKTEVSPGTATTLAIGPALVTTLNRLTGNLQLY